MWDSKNHSNEVHKQLLDEEVYEEAINDLSNPESTFFTALNKVKIRGDFPAGTLEYIFNKDPKFARFHF